MYKRYGKRLLDVTLALVVSLVFLPLLIVAILILMITSKDSPFYLHERPGYKGRPFILYKLRTMQSVEGDQAGNCNLARITRFGRFLRATSIDELPQVINVLRGDISLVGPRPLEMHYLPHYDEKQRRRHDVKPGITGLAQINGRNQLGWEEKFAFDVQYVDNISFQLDLQILLKTIGKVFSMSGVNSNHTSKTVEPFVPRSGVKD